MALYGFITLLKCGYPPCNFSKPVALYVCICHVLYVKKEHTGTYVSAIIPVHVDSLDSKSQICRIEDKLLSMTGRMVNTTPSLGPPNRNENTVTANMYEGDLECK